ncbi:hypothetical protein ASPZODRAFT_143987 [Penicilliopsis zonata CBS 506.65]|uniref:Uncharacterized protein n=1 Tax=Penicilliopsis zonata CBS 506.65 TaxID=1073090 RepID=A0A1L9SDY1_9EURO|nr:hypothetical protein ASPZODRAFT_143987 [Penicilliopsis zonata CBS 506.65]OJJ45352.1 hypothetical protein ASPZODRAFT_143987 [Penicilliopsis zonata CBS 506.65]
MDLKFSRSPSGLSETATNVALPLEMPGDVRVRLQAYTCANDHDDTAELLRQTFKYFPAEGRKNLTNDILKCITDSQIHLLAKVIENGLLTPIKVAGAKTVINPSPRIGVEDSIEQLSTLIDGSIAHSQAVLRLRCLERDGDMCVLSGYYDIEKWKTSPPDKTTADLEAAHIIPFSLASFRDETERQYITTVWNTIFRYFPGVRSRWRPRLVTQMLPHKLQSLGTETG